MNVNVTVTATADKERERRQAMPEHEPEIVWAAFPPPIKAAC